MKPANQYHVLSFLPAVERWEMPPVLEALAQQIVRSGKLRIRTDTERNFVHLGTTDTDKTFSARELTDPGLAAATRAEIARHVPRGLGEQAVTEKIEQLREDLKKGRGIEAEKELKVARVLVQSAHPAVIQRVLESGAELFVSYSHNVADLMALHFWDTLGTAGGLQSTERESAAVYVSCGGDPFFEGEEKTYTTDGFPALARMVIIAGQELGHFADLIHTRDKVLGRYAADNKSASLKPSALVKGARRADTRTVEALRHRLMASGLDLLLRAERGMSFYARQRRFSPPWIFYQGWRLIAWVLFWSSNAPCPKLRTFPAMRCGEALDTFLADMKFNLAPDADAYRREDPIEEEAIACIEAIARVPQQVHKWGFPAVQQAWPELTRVYYGTILPGTQAALYQVPHPVYIDIKQRINIFVHKLFRGRPGYYP